MHISERNRQETNMSKANPRQSDILRMVRDRGTKEPNREAALAAVNGLRERRVLISATGYHANTLKIRPPLVFAKSHADRLLTELDAVLRTVRA